MIKQGGLVSCPKCTMTKIIKTYTKLLHHGHLKLHFYARNNVFSHMNEEYSIYLGNKFYQTWIDPKEKCVGSYIVCLWINQLNCFMAWNNSRSIFWWHFIHDAVVNDIMQMDVGSSHGLLWIWNIQRKSFKRGDSVKSIQSGNVE